MEQLIFIGFVVLVLAIVGLGFFLSKKFDLTKEDYEFALILLGLVDYVSSKVDWKYQVGISQIMQVVMDALLLISLTYDRTTLGDEEYKELILQEAEKQCLKYNIEVDEDFVQMLRIAINHIIE